MAQSNAERQKAYRERNGVTAPVGEGDRNVTEPDWGLIGAEGAHCERCQQPAGQWVPPLDEHGMRMLGSDPRGWAPDHGPDIGLVCCRTFVCYDARPGHRQWPA